MQRHACVRIPIAVLFLFKVRAPVGRPRVADLHLHARKTQSHTVVRMGAGSAWMELPSLRLHPLRNSHPLPRNPPLRSPATVCLRLFVRKQRVSIILISFRWPDRMLHVPLAVNATLFTLCNVPERALLHHHRTTFSASVLTTRTAIVRK